MTHASARRSGTAGNERGHGLGDVGFDERGGLFLGLLLGVLCEASTIFNPKILPLLLLGILALLLSGIGGIIGGYVLWFFQKGKFNPVVGIAGVSCVPSTAKVAQKIAAKAMGKRTVCRQLPRNRKMPRNTKAISVSR